MRPKFSRQRNSAHSADLPGVAVEVLPTFIPPQLCKRDAVPSPPTGRDWVHEMKWNGYRMQLRVENARATLRSRSNLNWTRRFAPIATAADVLPNCIMDGEIVALGSDGLPSLGVLASVSERRTPPPLTFCVFDLLMIGTRDLRSCSLSIRKRELERVLRRHRPESFLFVEYFYPAAELFKTTCELRLEGIVAKRLDAAYRSGRSDLWQKVKCPAPVVRRTRQRYTAPRPSPAATARRSTSPQR